MYGILILVLISFTLALAYAQEEPEIFRLPPVVVDAPPVEFGERPDRELSEEEARDELERTPGGVGFVGEEAIEESRAFNEKDVLDFIPGVFIRPRFGAEESQISIRGSGLRNNFHLRGVNILIDGFAINNADGFGVFGLLELLSAKRIEVYKGANALRFGANTLGGAINVVTKTGYDADLVEARGEAGSFGFLKGYLGTGQVYEPVDFYLAGSDTELFDNYRQHSEQARRRIYSNIGYQLPNGTRLRFDFNYVRNDEELPGALTLEEFKENPRQANPDSVLFDERHDYNYYRAAFTVWHPLTTNQVLEFNTQFNFLDLDHPLSFAVIDNDTYNVSGELRYLVSAPISGHGNRLTIGLQLAYTNLDDLNFANDFGKRGEKVKDQLAKATSVALCAENQLDVTENFTLVFGGRMQYYEFSVNDHFFADEDSRPDDSDSTDFFSVTPRFGFIWNAAPTVQIFGNISSAYEPPILIELTAPGQLDGDLGELKAQKAWQFELGTRGELYQRVAWDISVYDIELWDEIQNVNILPFPDAPFTIPRFQNIPRSRHAGIEFGLDVVLMKDLLPRIGLGYTGDSLGIRNAYTFSYFVFVNDPEFGDNDLPGAPRHYIRSELRYDNPVGLWIAPNIEAIPEGYFVNSENTVKTDPYILFNFELGWKYKPWNLLAFFEASNLFDKNYVSAVVVDSADGRFFEPGDGRAFYAGLQWGWN